MSRVQAGAAGRSQTLAGEPLARACVVGASGFAGALAAAILWAHPRVSLEAVTARTEAGRRLDDLYPRHRVPLELEPFDAERLADVADVALVSYPHGAAAEVVAALRGRGMRVVDLSADFRLHDLALHERWYGPHGAPDAARRGGLRPDRAAPRGGRRARAWSPTPAATRPPRSWRWRRLRARA